MSLGLPGTTDGHSTLFNQRVKLIVSGECEIGVYIWKESICLRWTDRCTNYFRLEVLSPSINSTVNISRIVERIFVCWLRFLLRKDAVRIRKRTKSLASRMIFIECNEVLITEVIITISVLLKTERRI